MSTKKRLLVILAVGLILRLGLLFVFWDEGLTIVDETHYQKIAENIQNHHEFSLKVGRPTAIRPPLYPLFLSAIYFITGGVHLNAIRIAQILLSLGIILILYRLGKILFDEKIGLLASLIFAIYPTFLFFTHLLLTEALFTLLFLLFLFFYISFLNSPVKPSEIGSSEIKLNSKKRNRNILLAGLLLGLGSLTRSNLYPFLIIALLFIIFACRGLLIEKIKWVILLVIGFIVVVGPWTVRNHIIFKDLVVIDTMGGLNMYMGNYEHTPLNRAWGAIDLTGDKTWFYGHEKVLSEMNEAQKQKWAMNKAKEFILDHKWLTLKRDLIKTADFWGLEREVIGPIINGHWPRLNKTSYLLIITFFIFSTYALVLACSVFGILYHLRFKNKDVLFCVVLILLFTGMYAIVFGHSRYHLPLMPLLTIFASWSLMNVKKIWEGRGSWRQKVSIVLVIILIGIWVREILFIEGERFLKNIHV